MTGLRFCVREPHSYTSYDLHIENFKKKEYSKLKLFYEIKNHQEADDKVDTV